MVTLLHFADAHIDMVNYGRHDPQTGLPMRVMDFLKSLDTIVDAAITEKVDLVLFAGDAYKDRDPAPTFQREWERRIMRLSKAGIPTLLLVGNHDLSPALGRAHAIEEFNTLEVPYVRVIDRPSFLRPEDLQGLPLQVLALPWISRSGLIAYFGVQTLNIARLYEELEVRLNELIQGWLEQADATLPTVLAAHASVQGAKYGVERTIMLGADLVLSGSLVRDPRLDYVALGHIHKPQNLNPNGHPPVIYPGSIERIDFSEVGDRKYYVIAHLKRGATEVEWRELKDIRPFIERHISLDSPENVEQRLMEALPSPEQLKDAIVRLILEYPQEWESLINEAPLREQTKPAFEFQLIRRPRFKVRIRLPQDQTIGSLTPLELLERYWLESHVQLTDIEALKTFAKEIIEEVHRESSNE